VQIDENPEGEGEDIYKFIFSKVNEEIWNQLLKYFSLSFIQISNDVDDES